MLQRLFCKSIAGLVAPFIVLGGQLFAGSITIPNASMESPTTFFVTLNIDSWQKTPKPDSWDESVSGGWTNLVGVFKNTAPGSSDHIDNCDGNQAIWLFANTEAGLFQDYDSVDYDDIAPTHAFNATFQTGKAYQLKVGLLVGMGIGTPMPEGATLALSLYYRDALSNRMAVATTVVTNSHNVFSNATHLLDYAVNVPIVQPTDTWAGQNIGILFLSTTSTNLQQSGYWDLDNVRLTEISPPALSSPTWTNDQFQFLVEGEPGLPVEILAAEDPDTPLSNWTSLGTLTNITGTIPFVDTAAIFEQRFYQARQLP